MATLLEKTEWTTEEKRGFVLNEIFGQVEIYRAKYEANKPFFHIFMDTPEEVEDRLIREQIAKGRLEADYLKLLVPDTSAYRWQATIRMVSVVVGIAALAWVVVTIIKR